VTIKKNKLYNQLNREQAKNELDKEPFSRVTISFYKYFNIENPKQFRDDMFISFSELKVLGRIYVAKEGINAQISVPNFNYEKLESYLYNINELKNLRLNKAFNDDGKSFIVLKIKVRDKIVADGIDDPTFSMAKTGRYLSAQEFNQLTQDPNVVVVDMRNHYEYEIGHFDNAIEIPSDTFKQQLSMSIEMLKDKKDKDIVMYCTGGIRCEKASAWMLHNGFNKVYHLEGGIINYANTVKKLNLKNKFIGKNFVFDERLGEAISEEIISHCHQCGELCDIHTNCKNDGCHLLFIQCKKCNIEYEGCCSEECKHVIHLSAQEQKELRKGIDKGANIFNKAKLRLKK
jgi:UPF0176 protein